MKITSYFANIKTANETIKKLKSAGFTNAYLDANDHYIGNKDIQTDLAGTDGAESLSDLVLNSGSNDVDKGTSPLSAANPMASGMGNFEEITDFNCSVTIEADENNMKEAEEIIKNMGGELENPNISRNKRISKADVNLEEAARSLDTDISKP